MPIAGWLQIGQGGHPLASGAQRGRRCYVSASKIRSSAGWAETMCCDRWRLDLQVAGWAFLGLGSLVGQSSKGLESQAGRPRQRRRLQGNRLKCGLWMAAFFGEPCAKGRVQNAKVPDICFQQAVITHLQISSRRGHEAAVSPSALAVPLPFLLLAALGAARQWAGLRSGRSAASKPAGTSGGGDSRPSRRGAPGHTGAACTAGGRSSEPGSPISLAGAAPMVLDSSMSSRLAPAGMAGPVAAPRSRQQKDASS